MDFVTDQASRFIETLDRTQSFDELADLLEKTMGSLNIRFHAVYQFGKAKPENIETKKSVITAKPQKQGDAKEADVKGVHNMPLEWVQRYMERNYHVINPVVRKNPSYQVGGVSLDHARARGLSQREARPACLV